MISKCHMTYCKRSDTSSHAKELLSPGSPAISQTAPANIRKDTHFPSKDSIRHRLSKVEELLREVLSKTSQPLTVLLPLSSTPMLVHTKKQFQESNRKLVCIIETLAVVGCRDSQTGHSFLSRSHKNKLVRKMVRLLVSKNRATFHCFSQDDLEHEENCKVKRVPEPVVVHMILHYLEVSEARLGQWKRSVEVHSELTPDQKYNLAQLSKLNPDQVQEATKYIEIPEFRPKINQTKRDDNCGPKVREAHVESSS